MPVDHDDGYAEWRRARYWSLASPEISRLIFEWECHPAVGLHRRRTPRPTDQAANVLADVLAVAAGEDGRERWAFGLADLDVPAPAGAGLLRARLSKEAGRLRSDPHVIRAGLSDRPLATLAATTVAYVAAHPAWADAFLSGDPSGKTLIAELGKPGTIANIKRAARGVDGRTDRRDNLMRPDDAIPDQHHEEVYTVAPPAPAPWESPDTPDAGYASLYADDQVDAPRPARSWRNSSEWRPSELSTLEGVDSATLKGCSSVVQKGSENQDRYGPYKYDGGMGGRGSPSDRQGSVGESRRAPAASEPRRASDVERPLGRDVGRAASWPVGGGDNVNVKGGQAPVGQADHVLDVTPTQTVYENVTEYRVARFLWAVDELGGSDRGRTTATGWHAVRCPVCSGDGKRKGASGAVSPDGLTMSCKRCDRTYRLVDLIVAVRGGTDAAAGGWLRSAGWNAPTAPGRSAGSSGSLPVPLQVQPESSPIRGQSSGGALPGRTLFDMIRKDSQ